LARARLQRVRYSSTFPIARFLFSDECGSSAFKCTNCPLNPFDVNQYNPKGCKLIIPARFKK
jgi:hypothetical protein